MMVQWYSFHLSCGCVHHLLPAFQVPDWYVPAMAGALQAGLVELVLVLMALEQIGTALTMLFDVKILFKCL